MRWPRRMSVWQIVHRLGRLAFRGVCIRCPFGGTEWNSCLGGRGRVRGAGMGPPVLGGATFLMPGRSVVDVGVCGAGAPGGAADGNQGVWPVGTSAFRWSRVRSLLDREHLDPLSDWLVVGSPPQRPFSCRSRGLPWPHWRGGLSAASACCGHGLWCLGYGGDWARFQSIRPQVWHAWNR